MLVKSNIKNCPEWSIETYSHFLEYIESNNGGETLKQTLIKYVASNAKNLNFKWPIEIGTVQFIACVFPQEKLIKIASKQLQDEVLLLKYFTVDDELKERGDFAESIAEVASFNSPTDIELISSQFDLPLFNEDEYLPVHNEVIQASKKLSKSIASYKMSLLEKLSNYFLDLVAHYNLIRIHMLKFLAILPCLDHDKSGAEVKRVFLESLERLLVDSELASIKLAKGQDRALPNYIITTSRFVLTVSHYLPAILLTGLIRLGTAFMARRFIAGKNILDANKTLNALQKTQRDATIDILGELVLSEDEADLYTEKVLEVINGLHKTYKKGEKNAAGIYRAHVSIKVTALTSHFCPQDFDYSYAKISDRLIKILIAAKKESVFLNIDAEHYHYRDCIFHVYAKALLETAELSDYSQTGIVLQAYLKDAFSHFLDIKDLAEKRKLVMPIRLVKGAYWDAETIEASAHNFETPEFVNKDESDIHYRQLMREILKSSHCLQLTVASHNIADHCFGEVLRKEFYQSAPKIEHQCLHMTYEALSVAMAKSGWVTRNYIPIGDLLVGMAYLVRRIMENSSQVGVLTIMRSHKKITGKKDPTSSLKEIKDKQIVVQSESINVSSGEFRNIYPIRTYIKKHLDLVKKSLAKDLAALSSDGGLFYNDGDSAIFSNSNPSLLLSNIHFDSSEMVDKKIEILYQHFLNHKSEIKLDYKRACSFLRLSELMLFRREELVSLIMLEAGKSIEEAIADVDEAIDFVSFYLREQLSLEENKTTMPQGVLGVIAPWNFPLAIPCGMTVAALVSGNQVLLKASEKSNLIAKKFIELCYQAGIPSDQLQLSCGEGDIGKYIVEHPFTKGIIFTGSKKVGEGIYQYMNSKIMDAYESSRGFAITEMGGKNGIIVTNNCELDETIEGILYSAFAHSGQKCSAASRVIVDEKIMDSFIFRFKKAVRDLPVGSALDFSSYLNPLINEFEKERIKSLIDTSIGEVVKYGGEVIIDRSKEEFQNSCLGPCVVRLPREIVLKEDTVAGQEVFGPLIHIIGYSTLAEALQLLNGTEYALTAGIYCQSQNDIDELTREIEAGNIYINRPCTGARVAIEPFGGFKKSGTGPKAGSKEYLLPLNQIISQGNQKKGHKLTRHLEGRLPFKSGLPIERRVEFLNKFLEMINQQFELLFDGICIDEKQKLLQIQQFFNTDEYGSSLYNIPHREIPGQLSYGDNFIPLGSGAIIDSSNCLQFSLLVEFIASIFVGNGTLVIACNDKVAKKWELITNWCIMCGFSEFNISLSIASISEATKMVESELIKFIIVSHDDIFYEKQLQQLAWIGSESLLKFYSNIQNMCISERIHRLGHRRSFAVNTMRHGASLALDH